MLIDKIVFVGCMLAGTFVAGLMVGEERMEDQILSRCIPQAGEKLAVTIQNNEGVTCVFAQFPARAKISRKAS